MNKVAKVTIFFWIMKICATTLGEIAGDQLSMTMNVGYILSTAILMSVFVATLLIQLRSRRFHPVIYWLALAPARSVRPVDNGLSLHRAQGTSRQLQVLVARAVWNPKSKRTR